MGTHPGLVFLLDVKEAFWEIILEVHIPLLVPVINPEQYLHQRTCDKCSSYGGKAELGPCKPAALPGNKAFPKCTNCRNRAVPCSWGTLLPPALNGLKIRVHKGLNWRRPRGPNTSTNKLPRPSQRQVPGPPDPPVAGPSKAPITGSTQVSRLSAPNSYNPDTAMSEVDLFKVTREVLEMVLAGQDTTFLKLTKAIKQTYMS